MRFSVISTLTDNDLRHHSGQNGFLYLTTQIRIPIGGECVKCHAG